MGAEGRQARRGQGCGGRPVGAAARWLGAVLLPLALACGTPPPGGEAGDGGTPDAGAVEEPRDGWPAGAAVDLRADVDRDGTVELDDPADEAGEEGWSAERGAVFLANLDDDEERCPREMYPAVTPDATLAGCHDAADAVVNGTADLEDLARLRLAPFPAAPPDAVGRLRVEPAAAAASVRLFVRGPAGFTALGEGTLGAAALREGVELAIEARDVVRGQPGGWDGTADVVLEVVRPGGRAPPLHDRVRLRVAPVVTSHHLDAAETLYVSRVDGAAGAEAFRAALHAAAAEAGVAGGVREFAMRDRWMQDLFETGSMAMPAPGGRTHAIRVFLRSPNVRLPGMPTPLRVESRVVYFLRGRDAAVVQQFEEGKPAAADTLDALGNLETVPPYEKDGVRYPLGRLLRGRSASLAPDASFWRMLEAQGAQPVLDVDTTWLYVAHVDEVLSFLPAPNARGWVALVNDPALARRMLEDLAARGHGEALLFAGKAAEATVSEVLADPDVKSASEAAAVAMEELLAALKAETGLTDAEVVRVPFLHTWHGGRAAAYQPGTTNLLVLSPTRVLAPDPLGPVVDGKDVFRAQLEGALAPLGVGVGWVDAWEYLHLRSGEVHCGTNALRALPRTPWWSAGR
jgi:protein-arginine deiminase